MIARSAQREYVGAAGPTGAGESARRRPSARSHGDHVMGKRGSQPLASGVVSADRLDRAIRDARPEPRAAVGNLDGARAQLEAALRLDPTYRTAHENLGDVFVRLALRAFEAAAGPRSLATLTNKLRLARELAAVR